MDVIDSLKQDVHDGRINSDQLLAFLLLAQQQLRTAHQNLQTTQQQLQTAQRRIEELEKKLGGPPSAKVDQPFSLRAEEKRQEARGGQKPKKKPKGRRGRPKTQDKIARAKRTEAVYPQGLDPNACKLSHTRVVWRLEDNRAVLVAYQVFRGPGDRYGQIPGVFDRGEFGIEIVAEVAYLVYTIGLSFDKVCQLLPFFQDLPMRKSQVDALLYRLSRLWERQFDMLCTLVAHSLVVHADETSWSIKSVWAFLSEKARVLLFGVNKDAETLQKILDPATFGGLVISDDAAVYAGFSQSQKCWAHLLRKGIKLTLQEPKNADYRALTDELLSIYQQARRVQRDGRLREAGRTQRVVDLENRIFEVCAPMWLADLSPLVGIADDYRLLINEVMRLTLDEQLFLFVTAPPVVQLDGTLKPVAGTNNEAERSLRGAAEARKTGRTSKSSDGARRQTIVVSVLESLRLHLATFTLAGVIAELRRWWTEGRSCFEELVRELGLVLPEGSAIDRFFPRAIPGPSG